MSQTSPQAVLARSGRTFHLASKLLPKRMREDAAALSAFCRRMDDLADEGFSDGVEQLCRVVALLEHDPLSEALEKYGWPVALERQFPNISKVAAQLVRSLAADAGPRRIATVNELDEYAHGVAGTVGIMMCRILGAPPAAAPYAAALGKAMQLTNIARDVREDLHRDRIYLPASWIAPSAVAAAIHGGEPVLLIAATHELLQAADCLYASGHQGMHFLPWRARVGILAAAACYREIGMRVAHDIPGSWQQRLVVSDRRKAMLVLRSLVQSIIVPRPRASGRAIADHNAEARLEG
jgi:phytoene synthase